jgi:hypothetical protein
MRHDWKKILNLVAAVLLLNCAWVVRTREEIDRPSIDISPMTDSLLVMPDSSVCKHDTMISFQIRWRYTYDKPTQPILTFAVRTDGAFSVLYEGHRGEENIDLGFLKRSDIQPLVHTLNEIGFFHLGGKRFLYEHFDVEKTYIFGILAKTNRQLTQNCPSDVTYHFDFAFKNFRHKGDYCGMEGITDDSSLIHELEILKNGCAFIDDFFEREALDFSEKSYSEANIGDYQIIPAESLDANLEFAQKTSPWVSISGRKDKDYAVVIKVLVAPDGQVVFGLIQEPSGYCYFDYRALFLIKSYKYTPPKYHGSPVYTWISLPLRSILCER